MRLPLFVAATLVVGGYLVGRKYVDKWRLMKK